MERLPEPRRRGTSMTGGTCDEPTSHKNIRVLNMYVGRCRGAGEAGRDPERGPDEGDAVVGGKDRTGREPLAGGETVYTQRENLSQEGRQHIPSRVLDAQIKQIVKVAHMKKERGAAATQTERPLSP
eukprot:3058823-Pyramimonas_sp.AAC.1